MKITKITPADVEQDLDNVSFREEFGKSIDILAENLAIAIAESKRWQSIEAISSEALDEAMEILEIAEIRSSYCTFKRSDRGIEVEYNGEKLH
tara:strand:- start:2594 stop:2872 length:279 start_codon:yes stop_codon:yes gene_type:complete